MILKIIIRIMVVFLLFKTQGKGSKAHCDGSSSREITGALKDLNPVLNCYVMFSYL